MALRPDQKRAAERARQAIDNRDYGIPESSGEDAVLRMAMRAGVLEAILFDLVRVVEELAAGDGE